MQTIWNYKTMCKCERPGRLYHIMYFLYVQKLLSCLSAPVGPILNPVGHSLTLTQPNLT